MCMCVCMHASAGALGGWRWQIPLELQSSLQWVMGTGLQFSVGAACSWLQSCLPSHCYHFFQSIIVVLRFLVETLDMNQEQLLVPSQRYPSSPSCDYCNSAMFLNSLHTCKPIGFHLISRGAKTEHLRSKQ